MSSIVYVTLGGDDIESIRSLWDELRVFTRDMSTHFTQYYEDLDFDDRIRKLERGGTETRIDVAREGTGGPIVGYAIGSVNAEGVGEVDSFYVAESHRRRGIGEQLLSRTVSWIMEHEPKECVILTAYENRAVLPLYEKLGFYPRLVLLNRK